MLKFLRKYQGLIMAVGGSLLMVAFLMPQAIQQLGEMGFSRTLGQYVHNEETHTFKAEAWREASVDMQFLSNFYNGTLLTGLIDPYMMMPRSTRDEELAAGVASAEHWYFLCKEAEAAGLMGGWLDGELLLTTDFLPGVSSQMFLNDDEKAMNYLRQQVANAAGAAGAGYQRGLEALGRYVGVNRLVSRYFSAPVVGQQRQLRLVRSLNEQASLTSMLVKAADNLEGVPEPTEEQLQSHFERFREVDPAEGEYGIGYVLPDRFKVEYLTIDYNSLLDQIEVTGLDARKWYREHPSEIPPLPETQEPTPYEDVAEDCIAAVRRERAEQRVAEIVRMVKSRLLTAVQALPRENGYRVLPEGWEQQRVSFEALREEIRNEFGVDVSYTRVADEWVGFEEFDALGPISGGERKGGASPIPFFDLVRSHREMTDEPVIRELQVGVADAEPLRLEANERRFGRVQSLDSDVIFYRMLGIDLSRPAKDLEEVRDRVVSDFRTLHRYEQMVSNLDVYRESVLSEGFEEYAESRDLETGLSRFRRVNEFMLRFTGELLPPQIGQFGQSQAVADAVFGRLEEWGPFAVIPEMPLGDRLVITPMPSQLGVLISRIEDVMPLTLERAGFAMASGINLRDTALPAGQVVMMLEFGGLSEFRNPFSWEEVRTRLQYEQESGAFEEEEGEESVEGFGPTEDADAPQDDAAPAPDTSGP